MSGLLVFFLLIFASALPIFPVLLWFRLSRFPLSRLSCLWALLAGMAALFPALLLQRVLPGAAPEIGGYSGRWGLLVSIFRTPFTEELSRLLALGVFFFISGDLKKGNSGPEENAGASEGRGLEAAARGAAIGLLAGLGFAMIESAAYGAADFRVTLPRAFTAAPLHGACGARIGSALLAFRERPLYSAFRFLSAVLIHGVYNFAIARSGPFAFLAVLIALFTLASSILEIRGGMKSGAPASGPREGGPV
jgi:RsiW-degrading membrane proteinase PrsW (M82 family)